MGKRVRITVEGRLSRHKEPKRTGGGSFGALFADYVTSVLHDAGKLPDKRYWPEWARVKCEAGALPEIGPRAQHLWFGKSGTAAKRHWESIPNDSRVRITASVEPWANQMGGFLKRVSSIEVLEAGG